MAKGKKGKKSNWLKKALMISLLLLLGMLLWQHELVLYGLRQAKGQINIIANAEPIEKFLSNPDYPDSLKQKLVLIQEAKEFAVDSLGMAITDNYTKMYNQHGMPVLWVVTASEPFQMIQKKWKFPLLGSFSYKGYFDLDLAQVEEKHLQAQGYDTGIRTVGGWSTLGWFDDPILSNMLFRNEGMLADLIIHELTHTTLYIKDSVQFNENLATFIGNKGAEQFLTLKYGPRSEELKKYVQQMHDRELFANHVITYYHKLDSLYSSLDANYSKTIKNRMKQNIIQDFVKNIESLNFYQPEKYTGLFEQALPNNTFFQSYLRYRGNMNLLEESFVIKFNANLKEMLDYYKNKYSSL